jgi:hypothetical protein
MAQIERPAAGNRRHATKVYSKIACIKAPVLHTAAIEAALPAY